MFNLMSFSLCEVDFLVMMLLFLSIASISLSPLFNLNLSD